MNLSPKNPATPSPEIANDKFSHSRNISLFHQPLANHPLATLAHPACSLTAIAHKLVPSGTPCPLISQKPLENGLARVSGQPHIFEKCSQAHLAWFFKCAEIQEMVFRRKKPISVFQGYVAGSDLIFRIFLWNLVLWIWRCRLRFCLARFV